MTLPDPPAGPPAPGPPSGALRIDREGTWRHEGQEITHAGVLVNLYANLRPDEDGGYYLQLGAGRIPVEVDDTPFLVVRVSGEREEAHGRPAVRMVLNDGSEERLDPETLWLGRGDVPYCRVKGGRFPARLTVPAWLQLAVFLDPDAASPTLVLGARRIPIPRAGRPTTGPPGA